MLMSASQPYPWNEIAEHGIDRNAILIARSAKDVHEEEKKINTRSLVYSFKIEIPTKTNVTSTTNK